MQALELLAAQTLLILSNMVEGCRGMQRQNLSVMTRCASSCPGAAVEVQRAL